MRSKQDLLRNSRSIYEGRVGRRRVTNPVEDLALISPHNSSDMCLDNRDQIISISDSRNPTWQLRVPNKRMSTNALVVGNSPVDEVIGSGPVEISSCC